MIRRPLEAHYTPVAPLIEVASNLLRDQSLEKIVPFLGERIELMGKGVYMLLELSGIEVG
jgi:hypothetical protein